MAFEIFCSYSHKDEELRKRLDSHLALLVRNGFIQPWDDRKIEPGQDWANEIDLHVRSAQIILLLVSSDFLASDYCYELEMKTALDRHSRGEAIVVPIIMRPCDWLSSPFAHLQALPRDGKAVTAWPNRDQAFTEVTKAIRELASRFQEPLPSQAEAIAGFTDRASPKPRVLDAAMPSHIVEGRATELLMLIRLPESKGLAGVLQEDEEAEARPEDVRSKPFDVTFPLGPTGAYERLKVTVELTSPDFTPSRQRKNIFIPVDQDSEVCQFLLTPSRTGVLTVVIELIWEDAERGFRRLRTNCVSESGLPQTPSLMNVVRLPLYPSDGKANREVTLVQAAAAAEFGLVMAGGPVSAAPAPTPEARPQSAASTMPRPSAAVVSPMLPSSARNPARSKSKPSRSPLLKVAATVVCVVAVGTGLILQRQGSTAAVQATVSNGSQAGSKEPGRSPAGVSDDASVAASEGTVVWEGEVQSVRFVRFNFSDASSGTVVSGKFPSGQPYRLKVSDNDIASVVSAPAPNTNFNFFVLRVQGEGPVRVTLHWNLLSADSR